MNRLFTEIIPWFMEKIGWDILKFELRYLLPVCILWLVFIFSIKILLRGNFNDNNS